MVGFPGDGPWPAIRKDLDRTTRRPVVAVVAFIGKDAPTVMPLRRDDTLVCDASELAVKRGLTSAAALRTFHRRGVQIFSMRGLHAKVIASPTSAWIGSANASKNSQDKLLEASVRVNGDTARALYSWACSLVTEDCEQSAADLRALAAIKVDRFRPGPTLETPPRELPQSLARLWIIETDNSLTDREMRTAEADRGIAKSAAVAAGLPARLNYTWLADDVLDVATGDWIIEIHQGRIRHPARVARVRQAGKDRILWHAELKTHRKPRIAELRALEPLLVPDESGTFGDLEVRGAKRTKAILELFR
jgi:hypothetical protein